MFVADTFPLLSVLRLVAVSVKGVQDRMCNSPGSLRKTDDNHQTGGIQDACWARSDASLDAFVSI